MVRIILRLLLSVILVANLLIIAASYLIGENVYKKYGKQIIKSIMTLILFIVALYVSLSLIGLH